MTTNQKEHPILFNAEMVRAVLDGRKNQTRRVMKMQPKYHTSPECNPKYNVEWGCHLWAIGEQPTDYMKSCCPYGQVGDRLWVREKTYVGDGSTEEALYYFTDNEPRYPETHDERSWLWKRVINKTIPSIHMPRWASRITLEITAIRVERVRTIADNEALKEGVIVRNIGDRPYHAFRDLWDSINKKRGYGWDKNPWVWVVEFKHLNPPITDK